MNRRQFLASAAAGTALSMTSRLGAGETEPPSRPNILYIISDQHSPRYSGFRGHPLVRTPHLDRLAQAGVSFDAAYCNSPLCVPSRMSLLTGKFPSTIEQWDNHIILPSSQRTYAHLLRDSGYDAVLAGKMHFYGEDQLHGFRAQLSTDIAAKVDLAGNPHYAPVPDWAAGGRVPGHSLKSLPAGVGTNRATEADDEAVEAFRQYLKSSFAKGPWCFTLGIFQPHRPWETEEEFWNLYRTEDMPLPPIPDGHLETMHPTWKRHRALHGQPDGVLFPDDVRRNAIHGYYAAISRIDAKVGAALAALEQSGQADNTIVIYTSDHGEMLGEHGMWMKSSVAEPSASIPLIIRWPRCVPAGERRAGACSLVDVTATLLDAAGFPAGALSEEGNSLLPYAQSASAEWSDRAFCEHYATWVDRPQAMLRLGRYKLSASHQEPFQLFDSVDDPYEMNDLIDDPAFAEIRDERIDALARRWDSADLNRRVIASQQQRMAAISG